ncbi:MAG: diacylglycerol kinase [Marinirhabdus sp.]
MWGVFVRKRLKGFRCAAKGAYMLIKNEASVQVQVFLAVAVTAAGFYFEISRTEWMLQTFAIGLVLTAEGLNTAAEKIADFVHPGFHEKIGHVKDVAAGAVCFAALAAVVIGCIVYIPKF